ncbi:MAG: DNA replication/repair protein RecF [Micromonosporaceae bacterium]
MHVSRLALTDFRSYPAVDLELGPGVTGFVGPNGHGKTNLVEALGYAATLGSHRTATDAPLVRRGAERAILRVQVDSASARTLVELEINPGRANRAKINRAPVRQPRQIIGALRTVLFAPEDLALVKGDPGQRRRFLDELLVARSPRFSAIRSDYERVLKQRTALLKSAGARGNVRGLLSRGDQATTGMLATLDTWDEHLARAGAELLTGRLELVTGLRPLVAAAYARLADGMAGARIRYRRSFASPGRAGEAGPDVSDSVRPGPVGHSPDGGTEPPADKEFLAAALRDAMARSRAAELERGLCLVGPHRDELELSIGDLPARGYASHGESWSLALALRLASYELLRAEGEDPVLLLDDVFAELDPGRRERLAELALTTEQALVTAADGADVPAVLAGARFTICDGAVKVA